MSFTKSIEQRTDGHCCGAVDSREDKCPSSDLQSQVLLTVKSNMGLSPSKRGFTYAKTYIMHSGTLLARGYHADNA